MEQKKHEIANGHRLQEDNTSQATYNINYSIPHHHFLASSFRNHAYPLYMRSVHQ